MKLYYKCACMDDEAEIDCPVRGKHESADDWVHESIAKAVSRHHGLTHPRCISTVMEYVKAPIAEHASIGFPGVIQ